jgi:hypothetical protein
VRHFGQVVGFSAAVVLACGPVEPPASTVVAHRRSDALVGVPQNGYPNYDERLMLVAMNRTRADPNNVSLGTKASCSTDYAAQPPLSPSYDGSRASRFHCNNLMATKSGLSHNSYCTLQSTIGTSGCDGSDACACVSGTEMFSCTTLGGMGTDPWTRTGYFGYSAGGEVGAAGYSDGWTSVAGWVTECAGSDGHRSLITSGSFDQAGLGFSRAGGGCWSTYAFSDLAGGAGTPPKLVAGVHYPQTGTSPAFYVNYYDPGGAPQSLNLVLDGTCVPMTKELGTTAGNATYKVTQSVSSGCHEYWFLASDSTGARQIWPEAGSWGVGNCSGYNATSKPASCEACASGGACTSPDGCKTGTTSCDGGTPSCTSLVARTDGTTCGTNQVCSGGACVACTSGTACSSPDGCKTGTTSCTSGMSVCSSLTPRADGISCGTNQVCSSGSCVACTSGAACSSPDGCKTGTTSCANGTSVCGSLANVADGTGCAGGACRAGVCTPRPDAGAMMDAGTVVPDAGAVVPDAGTTDADAGTASEDAGTDEADAGSSEQDAGRTGRGIPHDAGSGVVPGPDLQAPAPTAQAVVGVCGCGTGNEPAVLVLLLLATRLRRRGM